MPETDPSPAEILWRQYATHVDLYKFYMDLVLKGVTFFYAITGAILSYYFAHESDPRMKFALLLPVLMSVSFTAIFLYGARLMKTIRDEVFDIASKLKLETGIEVQVLVVTLWSFGIVLAVTAIGLAGLFWAQT
jgi:hypothetical protein